MEWTPDGEQILFRPVTGPYGQGSTYLIRTDASELQRISKSEYEEYFVEVGHTISPDGTRLVYVTSRHQDGKGFDLEMSNLDGSNRRRLTEHAGPLGGAPDWSPDGTLIAFANYHLGVIGADGQNERQIGIPGIIGNHQGRGPKWSPDGQTIAFVSWLSSGSTLYTINADGTGLTQVFAAPFASTLRVDTPISNPYWSPDGKHLTFTVYFDTDDQRERNGLYIAKPDGTGLPAGCSMARSSRECGVVPRRRGDTHWERIDRQGSRWGDSQSLTAWVVNAHGLVPRRITDGRAN